MNWRVHCGDIRKFCARYDGPPFMAMLTDPPYHLTSNRGGSKGFMGATWDGGDIAFRAETWAALAKHLLPGAFGMTFAGSRGWHRVACAIEDAGLRLHPTIFCWAFGSGFPKAARVKNQPAFEGHRYGLQAMKPAAETLLMFRKPLTCEPNYATICEIGFLVEGLICLFSSARDVESRLNLLHRTLRAVVDASVHGSVDVWASLESVRIAGNPSGSNQAALTLRSFVAGNAPTKDAMRARLTAIQTGEEQPISVKATAMFGDREDTLLNIGALWKGVLDAILNRGSMSTISTVSALITDLKISESCLSQIILACTQRHEPNGLRLLAKSAVSLFQSAITKLRLPSRIIATGDVTEQLADTADAQEAGPASRLDSVIVWQVPYEGKPVDSIVKHGAGALNIEAGRISYESGGNVASNPSLRGPFEGGRGGHIICVRKESRVFVPQAGRWPANFALQHHPDCCCAGVKKGKAPKHHNPSDGDSKFPHGDETTRPDRGGYDQTDADGLESVEEWRCVESCPVRKLDEQSGQSKSVGGRPRNAHNWMPDKGVRDTTNIGGLGDSGGASRFFFNSDWVTEVEEGILSADPVRYQAKAARKERDAGLDSEIQRRSTDYGAMKKRQCRVCGNRTAEPGAGGKWPACGHDDWEWVEQKQVGTKGGNARNPHPTVKPIKLCRWLASLLLPPEQYAPRRILIPFAGAGSECAAAGLAGWDEIVGVEREAEYAEIARARLRHWLPDATEAI